MEERILGRTGIKVRTLSYGAMDLRLLDLENAGKLLNEALDHGINYIDTCPEYPMSEYFIGKTISHRRNEFILATKCGDNMTGIGPLYQFDKKTVLSNLDNSLRQLKTDYIDVWQLHGIVPSFLPGGEEDEVLDVMREVKKSGKVRFLAVSIRTGYPDAFGYPGARSYEYAPVFSKWRDIDVIQLVYGGLSRMAEKSISVAAKDGAGIVARGILKKYKENYDAVFEESKLSELFEEGETRNGFLVRFAISHPDISTIIIGSRNYLHVIDNIKSADKGRLPDDVYEEAKRRLDFVGAISGPVILT